MTNFTPAPPARPRASWPVSLLCAAGGTALAAAAVAETMLVSSLGVGAAGGVLSRLVVPAAVVAAVFVARALPRRARAAFVTGLVVPLVIGAALVAFVLYSLATNPNTFTF